MVALAPVLLAAAPAIKLVPGPVAGLALLKLRGGEMDTTMLLAMLKKWMKALFSVLTAPLWFFDAVDKEAFVMSIPVPIRRRLLKVMFWPTLAWTMLLHQAMPDTRRWYDRVDEKVIIGALPLKRQLDTLARVERVTGVINFCDEFNGHPEYESVGMRQLRLPVLDYCAPSTQQLEAGLDFIKKQPAGGSVYVHCKAGRGRAGTMLMAYLIDAKGLTPQEAQKALSTVRPHVSGRLWKRPSVRELHRRTQQRQLIEMQQRALAQQQAAAAGTAVPGGAEGVPMSQPAAQPPPGDSSE